MVNTIESRLGPAYMYGIEQALGLVIYSAKTLNNMPCIYSTVKTVSPMLGKKLSELQNPTCVFLL